VRFGKTSALSVRAIRVFHSLCAARDNSSPSLDPSKPTPPTPFAGHYNLLYRRRCNCCVQTQRFAPGGFGCGRIAPNMWKDRRQTHCAGRLVEFFAAAGLLGVSLGLIAVRFAAQCLESTLLIWPAVCGT